MTVPLPRLAHLRAGCAAGALLLAGPAAAEITAGEVREDFQELYEGFGMTVEVGAEQAADGTVTLSDVVLSFEFTQEGSEPDDTPQAPAEPDRTVRVEAAFPEIAFEETPEGAVRALLPSRGDMSVTTTDAETGEVDTARLALATEGAELLVAEVGRVGADGADGAADEDGEDGGDGGTARSYALSAARMTAELVEASRGGEPVEGELLIAVEDVASTTTIPVLVEGSDDPVPYAQTGAIGLASVRMDLPIRDEAAAEGEAPPEPGRLFATAEARDLELSAEGVLPWGDAFSTFVEEDDPGAALRAGLSGRLSLSNGPTASELRATDPSDPAGGFGLDSSSEGGSVEIAMGADGMSVSGTGRAIAYDVEDAGMPIPRVEATLDEAEATVRMPLLAGDPAPFEIEYLISGLAMNEEVWALFDPEAFLPRDPLTYRFAVDGRMRLLADLFDERAQAAIEATGGMPMEVEEASLELGIEAVGASLDAQGDFTFDNADQTTFPGMPAPTGTLNVVATGIDALFEALSEMGLVPPDQLMPARMMLGLFARSDGSGGYTSEIEVDGATGSVTANGQRLR